MAMESAMIKAIREFKKAQLGEIRTVAPLEFYGDGKRVISVTFQVEYCEELGGEYKSVIIAVCKDNAKIC